jgi:hypothetical protein
LNPLVLPPIVIALLLQTASLDRLAMGQSVTIAVIVFIVGPLTLAARAIRAGDARTIEVAGRQTRAKMLPVAALALALGLGASRPWAIECGWMLTWIYAVYLTGTLALVPLYQRWKLSIHAAGLASSGSILWLTFLGGAGPGCVLASGPAPPAALAAGLLLAIPVVGWSRVHRKSHTWGEVAAGAALGLAIPATLWWVAMHLGVPVTFCADAG